MKKTVKKRFEITTTPSGKIYAEVGDIITISNRGAEYYNILRVNKIQIFSTWIRKPWIDAKCD